MTYIKTGYPKNRKTPWKNNWRYNWRSYEDAKKFVHSLNLKSKKEWAKFAKSKNRPKDIPSSVRQVYQRDGTWKGWGDWLGTGTIASFDLEFRPFSEARKFTRSLKFKSGTEWRKYARSSKKPDDIPIEAETVYKAKGTWTNWEDFLNTGKKPTKQPWRPFSEAREFAHSLNLRGGMAWREYSKSGKRPIDIPGDPATVYKKEWIGMGDWVGTGYIAHTKRRYATYDVAKKFCQSHGITSGTLRKNGWRVYCKNNVLPKDIPTRPDHIYRKEGTWKGWGDFTGTGRIADMNKQKFYLAWPEAKKEYRKLAKKHGIRGWTDWTRFLKTHKLPANLPTQPNRVYTKERVWRKMK